MTLTHTAYISRKLIKFGGIFVVLLVVGWSGLTAAIAAYKTAHPPYIPPTIKYGVLPKIVFPEKSFEKKDFSFELPNDSTPHFSDQTKVYIIYRPDSNFLALEEDTKTAKALGFNSTPAQIRTGVYEFKNDVLNQTLTMNVIESSFVLKYPYLSDQMLLNTGNVPGKNEAIEIAKSFLQGANRLGADIEEGEKKVTFWKIEYDGLKSVSSQSEANVARVDFFRKNLEGELKILSAEIGRASVSVLTTGSTVEGKKVVEVNYKYANIDRESFSTYPIKTTEIAINDLKIGNYWPISDVSSKNVIIRKIYLAYFEPVTLTNFMQPVFVFEGDGNFVAYVPAVIDKYVK